MKLPLSKGSNYTDVSGGFKPLWILNWRSVVFSLDPLLLLRELQAPLVLVSWWHFLTILRNFVFSFLSYIAFPLLLTIDFLAKNNNKNALMQSHVAFPNENDWGSTFFFFNSWAPSPKIYYSLAVVQKQLSSVFYDLPHLSGYDSPISSPFYLPFGKRDCYFLQYHCLSNFW